MENTMSLIISFIALTISVLSWFVSHSLSVKRDFINKKKEIRINYLINAWQLLESASNREKSNHNADLEKSIADIQLFGTIKQIKLAQNLAEAMANSKNAYSLELLKELRKDLRVELGLGQAPDKWIFLRF